MFITKMSLPRRTFLRGMGVTVALPLLEAMVPALDGDRARPRRTRYAASAPSMCRTARSSINGRRRAMAPASTFTPILKPLEAFRDHVCVVSGLDGPKDPAAGGHATAPAMWLTGASPKKTEGVDVRNETTIDQIIAKADRSGHAVSVARAGDRRLHRLHRRLRRRVQLHLHEHHRVGRADGAAADGNQPARRVRAAVRRHRARSSSGSSGCARAAASSTRCRSRPTQLQKGLGARDQSRLSEYLEDLREIERRIERSARNARDRSGRAGRADRRPRCLRGARRR